MWLEEKSIASAAWPEKKVCWDKICFGHIWQPGPSCPYPVAAQREKLEESTEKQKPEATSRNQRQFSVEKASEYKHKSQLQLWRQEKAAGTRQQEASQARGRKLCCWRGRGRIQYPRPCLPTTLYILESCVLTFSMRSPFLWRLSYVTY